jgi:hypothetical protein
MVRESLQHYFEAGFVGSLPHGPIEVGLRKRTNVRRDWFGIFELAMRTDLPGFQIECDETFPGREVVASFRGSMAVTVRSGECWANAGMMFEKAG